MKTPKHIIGIHLLNNLSGSPRVFADALKVLHEDGNEVSLYTSKGEGFLSNLPFEKRTLFYRWSNNRLGRLAWYIWSQLILFFQLLRYWNKPATIFINTLLPFGAAAAAWVMRKPVVYYLHETHIDPPRLDRFLRSWVRRTARVGICVSHFLEKNHGVAGIKHVVIHNPLPGDFAQAQTQKSQKQGVPLKALMVASLKKEKGLPEILDLARTTPSVHFTLVIGAPEEAVAEYFEAESVPGNLDIFPAQKDIAAFYARHDVLLNLSDPVRLPETFGMTILEGFAFGMPAIVPPDGGPAELVREGIEGFVIHPQNTDEIADTLRLLSQDKEAFDALSENALARVEDFRIEAFGKKLRTVFE
ncbi:MAG: glycosyltransferase family 4 protein [Bacteroidia bacterium]